MTDEIQLDDWFPAESYDEFTARKSAVNRTAHASFLSGDILGTYKKGMSEYESAGKSYTVDSAIDKAKQESFSKAKPALMGMLANPSISPEEKAKVSAAMTDMNGGIYDPRFLTYEKMLASDSAHETEEESRVRGNFADIIGPVIAYENAKQKAMARTAASLDSSTGKALLDFFELYALPFTENASVGKTYKEVKKQLDDGEMMPGAAAFLLQGEAKMGMSDMLKRIPIEQRDAAMDTLLGIFKDESSILLPGDNDYATHRMMLDVVSGDYSNWDRLVDNIGGLLDPLLFGMDAVRALRKAPVGLPPLEGEYIPREGTGGGPEGPTGGDRGPAEDATYSVEGEYIPARRGPVPLKYPERPALPMPGAEAKETLLPSPSPASVGVTAANANPNISRAMNEAVEADPTDVTAQAMYGANREDVIFHNYAPDPLLDHIVAKTYEIDRSAKARDGVDPMILDFVDMDGALWATKDEKIRQRAVVINDFANAQGVSLHVEKSQVGADEGGGFKIRAVYGGREGGFESPVDAFDSAKFALRDYGVRDSELFLLKRGPAGYEKVGSQGKRSNSFGPSPAFKADLTGKDSILEKETRAARQADDAGFSVPFTTKSGRSLKLVRISSDENLGVESAVVISNDGEYIGSLSYNTREYLNPDVYVEEEYRRDGIASVMYDFAEANGGKIPDIEDKGRVRTDDGEKFRRGRERGRTQDLDTILRSNIPGDYLVGVEYNYQYNPFDISSWDQLDVKRNFFDVHTPRISQSALKLQRNLMDAASMLHPQITSSAFVAVDKSSGLEKALLENARSFADVYSLIPSERKGKVYDYIKEANRRGLKFDEISLQSRGFFPDEIEALRSWKGFWDNHFFLEQYDLVRTLRKQGFGVIEHKRRSSRLFAKKAPQSGDLLRAYDLDTDDFVDFSRSEKGQLYQNGGYFAELRDPIVLKTGDEVTHVLIKNNTQSYIRNLRDNDNVLNYREGYYTIQYDAPRFIEKIIRDKKGKELRRSTVAVAGSTEEANLFIRRSAAQDGVKPEEWGVVREDEKGMQHDSTRYWDLQRTYGRTAQRFRGNMLEDATGNPYRFVVDPVQSMINQSRSIAARTSTRNWIEASKQRFMAQYKDVVVAGEDGVVRFPMQADMIRTSELKLKKKAGDARTTWEYIRYIEDGYINSLDEVWRAAFNGIANSLGAKGFSTAEKASLQLAKTNVTSGAKNVAFQAYLANFPLRQLLIQPYQMTQLIPVLPKYMGNVPKFVGQLSGLFTAMVDLKAGAKAFGVSEKEMAEILRDYERSGLAASIDKHNLIRGSLLEFTDSMALRGRAARITAGVMSAPQRVGFDLGENLNITSAWLAFRNEAVEKGLDVSNKTVKEEIIAKARAFTYGQNRAGDSPFNQGSLAMLLQFMIIPQRQAYLAYTNRIIPREQRIRTFAWNMLMYPVLPVGALLATVGDHLPEDPQQRGLIIEGLQFWSLNQSLGLAFDQDVDIDFSALNMNPAFAWSNMFETLSIFWGDGMHQALLSSPSGRLLLSQGGAGHEFLNKASIWMGFKDDYEDPVKFSEVANEFAKMASGQYSAYLKGKYMLEYQKKYDKLNGIVDDKVSTPEAIGTMLFGFPTTAETTLYAQERYRYEQSEDLKKDAKAWITSMSNHLDSSDISKRDKLARYLAIQNEVFRALPGREGQALREEILSQLHNHVKYGDKQANVFTTLVKDIADGATGVRGRILVSDMPEEDKQALLKMLDTAEQK